ncbi:MAG: hypothetical protein ABIB71_02030 [Candidatus Woesearchaeota archaeon]
MKQIAKKNTLGLLTVTLLVIIGIIGSVYYTSLIGMIVLLLWWARELQLAVREIKGGGA